MEDILARLKSGPVIVSDGAMGTMLQDAGLPTGMSPECWLLESPDPVRAVHRAYVEAGSDLILTCTFGGTRVRLKRAGLAERVAEVNRRAVEIARKAAEDRAYVAGDIGPLGEFLAPLGKITYEQAVEVFAEQAAALAESEVDVLYIETMSDLNEVRAAVEGVQQARSGIPIFVTLSFDTHGRTNMGVRPEQAAETLLALGVAACGANCGATLEMTEGAVAKMHERAPQIPLIAKPNAGKPRTVGRDVVYDATPEDMAEYARRFVALGARVVGGCCGSTPAHIAAIARAVRG
ncbi:MAG: homocysteine S-methyltransferase family protein [Chloroflexota bacterium]|nr:homocysteine S-methyltransferase family protein [Chloroflexota bacterium]